MMTHSHDAEILNLPGTAAERQWLAEHLEALSVKEGIVLAAAMQRQPPETMAEAVNHLLTLDDYDVYPASSYESLGRFYLWENLVPEEQRPFFDKTALGQWYEEEHPGLFIGNCYVAYPAQDRAPYDGECLPAGMEQLNWSVRLKLASEAVPGGVWVKLPDYDIDDMYGKPDEISLALEVLQVKTIRDCSLQEARCVLPCIRDLASQYDTLADLIYDAQNLGYILDERGQGSPDFLDRYFAVLEYEGCRRLDDAVNIAQELDRYDLVDRDKFMDRMVQSLSSQAWTKGGDGVKGCFDYAAYAAALAEQRGYQMTGDERFYIRKRDSPTMDQQPTGMIMQ